MASCSMAHANMIQFPRLPSTSWEGDNSHPSHPLPPRIGRTLKQSRSTENLTQRKDRVEFLRRREWTRRVAASSDQPVVPTRRARTYSWEDIVAAADAAASTFDYNSSGAGRPDTIDESDELDEPYVIYTATPRPLLQSANSYPAPSVHAYTPPHTLGGDVIYSTSSPSPSPSPSPTLSPLPATSPVRDMNLPLIGYQSRRGPWRGPHSRHSSLSSISEEDEGLARF
ncbi:hypothetical protein K466DRAFT_566773 [Polyporus arcularius HHB13444]|uniref:Uncharacterized protein n=1 Tax=Polyporus arcularius HHB13444 TaxID=1314778 RepID=A0A5C3P9C5_9APHY|nr:hypothetical protein K466DRAFT_566773 [Polyporus arcularius HHB13444]